MYICLQRYYLDDFKVDHYTVHIYITSYRYMSLTLGWPVVSCISQGVSIIVLTIHFLSPLQISQLSMSIIPINKLV